MMRILCLMLLAVALVSSAPTLSLAGDPSTKGEAAESAPDNTGRNVRDRGGKTLTSGDQSEAPEDIALTQKIRKAVVADDSLSMVAHNVKIITVNGVVTLRGPVKSEAERKKITAQAESIAGPGKVRNHLEVAPPK